MFFIGRDEHLNYFEQLCHAKTGAACVIWGESGTGKSLLLRKFREICKKKSLPYLLVDMAHFIPDQTAADTLQHFTTADFNWTEFQNCVQLLQNHYPNHSDIIATYQKNLPQKHSIENNISPQEENRFKLLKTLFQKLGTTHKTNPTMQFIHNPEKFLLENLKNACKNNPIILIDSYEHLYQNPRLMNKRLQIMFDFHGDQLVPLNQVEQPLIIDWFDALLEWLVEQGAIVMIASEQIGQYWKRNYLKIENFSDAEQLNTAQQFSGDRVKTTARRFNQDLARLLDKFSFKGNPLWFNVALNILEEILAEGQYLAPLFHHKKVLKECFDHSFDNSDCKLALIKQLVKRQSEIHHLWKIALPYYLDRNVLAILFGEQADTIRLAFQKAGLLFVNHQGTFILHEQIRDLFLWFAKQNHFLEQPETQLLYLKLVQHFEKRLIIEEIIPIKNLFQEEIKYLNNQIVKEPQMPISDIHQQSGTYVLILEATHQVESIRIGRFGKMQIEKGFYVYVGSAFGVGGLQNRIKRQLQIPRKKHWHIDYLRSATQLKEAWFSYDEQRRECEWATVFSQLAAFSQPVKGFGSSDCKTCSSHLFYSKNAPIFDDLQTKLLCDIPLQRAILG